jgi:hypothetical protein
MLAEPVFRRNATRHLLGKACFLMSELATVVTPMPGKQAKILSDANVDDLLFFAGTTVTAEKSSRQRYRLHLMQG